jgi:exodeoxyribonuclease VII large subunit
MVATPRMVGDRKVYPVSDFNSGVASWLAKLPRVWVEGEVTEVRGQPTWTTVFITLSDVDDGTTLSVTMARTAYEGLENPLTEGARVHAFGRPELYEARGTFQLRAITVEPVGKGDLLAQLHALRARLADEGLFDAERKRHLPRIPTRVGIVTGRDAAAKQDIISTATSRFPAARLLLFETTVQGPRAPLAISGGLQTLAAEADIDVIVLTRGGGSFEDLLPFSDERVVRAVAESPVPVVSAVGHEDDHPLCDLAADTRAATPTAAAALVVPDAATLLGELGGARASVRWHAVASVRDKRERIERERRLFLRAPVTGLVAARGRLSSLRQVADGQLRGTLGRRRDALGALSDRLRALSPAATLERGYALVRRDGHVLTDAGAVPVGAKIDVTLARGSLVAGVETVEESST